MVIMRVKRLATKEEMELFTRLGNRLLIFRTVPIETKNGIENYYKNINAVVTVAFFVSYLCKKENEADKEAFLREMENLSESDLLDKIVDMALDYFEDYANKKNNQFLIALGNSNKQRIQELRAGRDRVRHYYWEDFTCIPVIPSTSVEWNFNNRDMEYENNQPSENVQNIEYEKKLPSEIVQNMEYENNQPSENVQNIEYENNQPSENVQNMEYEKDLPSENVQNLEYEKDLPSENVQNLEYEKDLPSENVQNMEYEKDLPSENVIKIVETKEFSEGMAAIRGSNDRWGFLDENGIITIEMKYRSVTPFYHGVSVVYYREDYEINCYHEKWVVIDKKGNELEGKWIDKGDDYEIRYEGIGKMISHVTETDRDPDREYWTKKFVFDTGESIWLCSGCSSYSGSSTDDWNKGYISIK